MINQQELEALKANSLSLENARVIADQIEKDPTVGGIFPNGNTADFTHPDIEKFKSKWCPIWPYVRVLLNIAKIFTNDRVDKVIDALLALGDEVCV
jgi:hypothetical protein